MDPVTSGHPLILASPTTREGESAGWNQSGSTIWIATHLDGVHLLGIVTERRPGVFTAITASCHDLGNHATLAAAKTALEEHQSNAPAPHLPPPPDALKEP